MDEVLTQKQVAEMLHHNQQSISWLQKNKGLPVHFYAREPRYLKSEILEWVKSQPNIRADKGIGEK